MKLFGRPKKEHEPKLNMFEMDTSVRELRNLISLAESNGLKPTKIKISENVMWSLDALIKRKSPKNNLKKDILIGLPVEIVKDIQLIVKDSK